MIISKTPLRMSYVGGGSDLPSFYRKYGGAVISTAINKYIYIMVKNRFEKGIRISYSVTENVNSKHQIKHPIVKNALDLVNLNDDIEIVSMADIPATGTGLGSSSSFSVGLLKALYQFQNKECSIYDLAENACHLEIQMCNSPIGKQDQYAAAFGGLKVYKFNEDDSVTVEDVECTEETIRQLNNQTLAFYIAGKRDANTILRKQSSDMQAKNKADLMLKMVNLVPIMRDALVAGNLENFGSILHENWELKRTISGEISNSYINELYNEAIICGATGGKLLGAGGGGFMIFHTPNSDVKTNLRKRFSKLREVKFNIEDSGSVITYNNIGEKL